MWFKVLAFLCDNSIFLQKDLQLVTHAEIFDVKYLCVTERPTILNVWILVGKVTIESYMPIT